MLRHYSLLKKFAQASAVLLAVGTGAMLAQTAEELRLTLGKSVVIDYPTDVRQISTTSPEVLDYTAVSTREILLNAKGLGNSTLIVWSKTGQRTFYNVNVEMNLEPIRQLIKESFPSEPIAVHSSKDTVTLTGLVSSKDVSDRAAALAAGATKTVINNLVIKDAPVDKQILLRVKFAELDREKEQQFGINLLAAPGNNALGSTTGQFGPPSFTGLLTIPQTAAGGGSTSSSGSSTGSGSSSTGGTSASTTGNSGIFTISQVMNLFAFDPHLNLGAFIKALQNENILQILAEPNLVASNGKEANFTVGGEFPVPILQGGANSRRRDAAIQASTASGSPVYASSDAQQHHQAVSEAGGLDFGRDERGGAERIQHPGIVYSQGGDQRGAGRRPELHRGGPGEQPGTERAFEDPHDQLDSDPGHAVQDQRRQGAAAGADHDGDAGDHDASGAQRSEARAVLPQGIPEAAGSQGRRQGRDRED